MSPLITHLASASAAALISATLQATLLTFAVTVLLRFIPNLSTSLRSFVWLSIFFIVAALPLLSATRSVVLASSPASLNLNGTWAVALIAFWAALSLFRVAQLIRSATHLNHISRAAQPVRTLEDARKTILCSSDDVDIPCVAGFFRPRILIPVRLLTTLSTDDLSNIVAHEQAHLARFDDWTNVLQKLLVALYPIHPVLFWIEHRLCLERELACDDAVLRGTASPQQYALSLANLAEQSLAQRGFTLALRAWDRRSELTRRILRILQKPGQPLGRTLQVAFVTAFLTALTTGTIALSRIPQLVSFSTPTVNILATKNSEPRPQPTNFAATSAVRPKLVRAALLDRPHKRVSKTKRSVPSLRRQQWLMLTTFPTAEAPADFHLTLYQRPSYAAVPIQNGWLVIQL